MIKQQVSNYEVLAEFPLSNLKPNGDSASPKEMIFHILPDNSQDVSILDIGFGAGTLGKLGTKLSKLGFIQPMYLQKCMARLSPRNPQQ